MEIKITDLRAAALHLRAAHMSVSNVAALFFAHGYGEFTAKLKDISNRLADEITAIERMIETAEAGGKS